MRILMTTDTVGGVWSYTRELVLGLLQAVENVEIFLFTVGASSTPEQHAFLRDTRSAYPTRFHFTTTAVPLEWEQDNAQVQAAEPLLLHIAEAFQPDVLHSNQFCYGSLPVGCARLVVAHSDVLSWHRTVHGVSPQTSPWLQQYEMLVHRGIAETDALVAPTRWMLLAFGEGFGLPERSRVIANGVGLQPGALPAKQLQAVTAGRLWDPAKNIAMLGDVASPMPVLVAGEARHGDAVLTRPDSKRVRLLGALPHHDLLTLFAESAMYVSTARYEPFGLAALEAARTGCALLSLDIASMREVWGDAALYFRNAAELQALLALLADDSEKLRDAQERAAAASLAYTRQRMTSEYLRLYRELIMARPPAETSRA